MKRLIVGLCICMLGNCLWATEDPDVIVYQAGGETYFVTGDILQQLKNDAQDTCLEHVIAQEGDNSKTTIIKFYELLLGQCRQEVSNLIGDIRTNVPLFQQTGNMGDVTVNDDVVATYLAGRKNVKLKNTTPDKVLEKYNACVLLKQDLQDRLDKYNIVQSWFPYRIGADINSCVQSIDVMENLDKSMCPLNPTVSDRNDIAGMENMNATYLNKNLMFPIQPNVKTGQVAIFNGRAMVVCDNGRAVHVVKPAFSGYTECRDARFQAYPNVGTLPDGIYLVQHDAVEKREDIESWGGYRVPLIPSQDTDTFGRANFYLHGTSNANKFRSGGCISLGVQIEEFIESDWFQNSAKDLIIIVDKYN